MDYRLIIQTILNVSGKTFILGIFLFSVAKQILYWVWLWQLKEYRPDRFFAHLEIFPDIKKKLLFFLGYYGLRKQRIPKFTKKTILIIALTAGLYLLFLKPAISLSVIDGILVFFILYLLIPVFVWIFVDIVNVSTSIEKEKIIKQAQKKIQNMPNLIVIGITGSYGKSSTKEILAEILSKKFTILKTPANINTPIGISKLILEDLNKNHQIFIVEMGAYKLGEIEHICKIAPPEIGILTGINEQHLALFGNLRNTIDAKFELIKYLPENGLAVLNWDNLHIKNKIKNLQAADFKNKGEKKEKISLPLPVKNIIYYSAVDKTEVYATNIIAERNKLAFNIVYGNESVKFQAYLAGVQNVYNILAAVAAALYLGMTLPEISQIVEKISPRDKTMKEYEGKNGSFLIADTYNSNPNGVMAALDYLKVYGGKKIVVFGGIIELGRASKEMHQKIGAKIAENADLTILPNPIFAKYIKKGALSAGMTDNSIIIETNKKKIYNILADLIKPNDVILFLGRDGEKVLELLKK